MNTTFWEAFGNLSAIGQFLFFFALFIAFAFEFINGFHDTANAVTTVIYTKTLKPTPAVFFSGFMNFLGVLIGGTTVAFSIVNLLPVGLLIEGSSSRAIVMVIALLLAGVIWNLGTWWMGLPVSSSHTLIGSILGVGLANSLMTEGNLSGVNWNKAMDVGKALLLSPMIGFFAAAMLLLAMKVVLKNPNLYHPPGEGDNPPSWIRAVLIATCGGVSMAHGSNDGQKGMGLILLALIGFLPAYYAMDLRHPGLAVEVHDAAVAMKGSLAQSGGEHSKLIDQLDEIESGLAGKSSLKDVPSDERWQVRQSIYRFGKELEKAKLAPELSKQLAPHRKVLKHSIEYVPFWVVLGVALALGIGTTICRYLPCSSQHHPSPLLRNRRHHVGQQVRGAARYDSQDPHRLGTNPPDGDLARRDPLFPRGLDFRRVSLGPLAPDGIFPRRSVWPDFHQEHRIGLIFTLAVT